MKKFVVVTRSGKDYKVLSSSDNFDEILESCEILSKRHKTIFRGQMISDRMAQLDHQYNGIASQAICMKKLVA
jgi:hypothetical protein